MADSWIGVLLGMVGPVGLVSLVGLVGLLACWVCLAWLAKWVRLVVWLWVVCNVGLVVEGGVPFSRVIVR